MEREDQILLDKAQVSFPVASRPYAVLAELAGISEDEALTRIRRLRGQGMIRRLGGVFDSRRLGYFSTLCAAKVPADKISPLAGLLEQQPGVTHNYLRTHAYNMWFTLMASTQSKAESLLADIREQSGIREIFSLPALRVFKIYVQFQFRQDAPAAIPAPPLPEQALRPMQRTPERIALIRQLQEDLPDGLTPYALLAERLGSQENDVLRLVADLLREGVIRRFGAVLRHQQAGFTANVMGVWQVPEAQVEKTGLLMRDFPEVSHCYQRPTLPDWPFNLFTMIHGRTPEDCAQVMNKIALATGIRDHDALTSVAELKKTSMKYFMAEEA
ncbi:MAG: Lrp/AsnC family transcriptional regulator [Peptococcaceae bacterium]|nr:Lrp/AsnC family transcriptional regulator [Peptococcaceae bacterium]